MENSRASSWAKSWKMARHHWGLASDAGPLMNAFNSWTSREFPAMLGVSNQVSEECSAGEDLLFDSCQLDGSTTSHCVLFASCVLSRWERIFVNLKYIEISLDSEKKWRKNWNPKESQPGNAQMQKGPMHCMKGAKVYFSLPFFEFRIHIPVPFLVMTSHDSLDFPNFDFLWMYLKIRDLQNPRRKIMCWDSKCDMLHIKFTWNLRTNLWVDWFHEGDYDYKL